MWLSCLAMFAALAAPLRADEMTAADLLPGSSVMYAELSRPKEVLAVILDHPLRQRLEALPPYRQALEQPDYLRFKAAVAVVEAQLEMPWRKLVEAVTDGGLFVGVDAETEGLAVLVRARDAATLDKTLQTLLKLARDEAQRQGQDDPVKSGQYREVTAYRAGEARLAVLGGWLLLTNKDRLGQRVIDNYLDSSPQVLAKQPAFVAARQARDASAAAWSWFDLATLRTLDRDNKLFRGPRDNPVGELLVGGLFGIASQAPYATVSLHLNPRRARLVAAMPLEPAWVGESRQYYLGPEGQGEAPTPLGVDGQLLSVRTYRNLSEMWLRADDLFDQNVVDQLAQADSNLSTLFSGKDFGEDILGSFDPRIHVLVARQDFGQQTPQPAIKLPAFALVAQMKDPETVQPELRRIFMSLVGFLNVVGAMNGQPQLDLETITEGERKLVASRFLAEKDEQDSKSARINFNFSPTVGFLGSTFVLSSTRRLADQLLEAAGKPASAGNGSAAGQSRVNTDVQANLGLLRDVLDDNRQQLISQNMLEQGHTRAEAEYEIGLLLELLGLLRSFGLQLDTLDGQLRLQAQLELAE
ncbi:MAG: hypothetical protein J5I93_17950 [Pirellulaceae bacterium]|nr:hypothetical protein [Pirellulaceae bacterium]